MTCSAIDCPLAQQPDQSCPSSPPQQRLAQGTSACLNSSKRRVLGSSVGLGELNWSLGDRLQLSSKFTRFTGTAPHFTCGQIFSGALYIYTLILGVFKINVYLTVLATKTGAGLRIRSWDPKKGLYIVPDASHGGLNNKKWDHGGIDHQIVSSKLSCTFEKLKK